MELSYSWEYFKVLYGEAGSRIMFEKLISDLLRKENLSKEVHRMSAEKGGDGGIDIYVSQGESIDVYQCKFFSSRNLENAQKKQISNSFNAILKFLRDEENKKERTVVTKWFLCIPHLMTPNERRWFNGFKKRNENRLRKELGYHTLEIQYIDGEAIISRLRDVDLLDTYFEGPGNQRDNAVTVDDLVEYYHRKKDISLKWQQEYSLVPTDFLKLYGICDDESGDETINYIDLLELILRPSDATQNKNIRDSKYKVIYGPSSSGLTYLCKTAFQCFLHGKNTEFKNIAYFSIVDEELENDNNLADKLKIGGKSIFSDAFSHGLIIIDGIGKVFENQVNNRIKVLKLIELINTLNEGVTNARVVITVRGDIEHCNSAYNSIAEDTVCIQNTMLNSNNESIQTHIQWAALRANPENRMLFSNPMLFSALDSIMKDQKSVYYTESKIIDKVLHAGISDNTKKEIDKICSELAYDIFSKEYSFLWAFRENTDEFKDIPFIAIEGKKVGFKSRIIYDYYVATFFYGLFVNIDERQVTIDAFMKALSARRLPDREYNNALESITRNNYEECVAEFHREEESDESILCFFLNRCADECGNEETERKILRRLGYMFYHISDGKLFVPYCDDAQGNPGSETAIANFIKIYRNYYDFSKEKMKIFKPIFSSFMFEEQLLPKEIKIIGGLSKANFKNVVFGCVKMGESSESEDIYSYHYRKDMVKKKTKASSVLYGTEIKNTSFSKSIFQTIEIANTVIESGCFDNIVVENKFNTMKTLFNLCSFRGAKMEKACFKKTIFCHTDFWGMHVNRDAFDDAVIDNKIGKQISDDEWLEKGVSFY